MNVATWIKRVLRWLGAMLLLLGGMAIGILVGYEGAGGAYDIMLEDHYKTHEATTASCVGKPEPCRYGIDLHNGMGCASWWIDGGRMMKMYCAPLLPSGEKPLIPPLPKKEPTKKNPKTGKPEIRT